MAIEIIMPNQGFDTQESRLIEWLKQPGDRVRKGEAIAIIESDKANVELESSADGIMLEHLYHQDEVAPVGAVIAHIGEPHELGTAPSPAKPASGTTISPVARRIAAENKVDFSQVSGSGSGRRIMRSDVEQIVAKTAPMLVTPEATFLALPKVRRAAREAGLDLSAIPPSGSHRQVTMKDLVQYQISLAKEATPEGAREISLSPMRQRIGQRLSQSIQTAPHFYVSGEFDCEAALARLNSLPTPQPRINDLIQYLTVQTLLRTPALNAVYRAGRLYQFEAVNLAVAVALEDGLITPVIRQAERYSLSGLAAESRALIQRARENHLQADDLQNGTFTISNLGIIGEVDEFTAIINPPQVGILAVGAVKQRPVVLDGGLHVRHTVKLTLSGDHRVVDGLHLGQFMQIFQAELSKFSR
jgi:pyruvate dehydrogenase E2 component (dihydrolipoamide acetyltransferase)